MLKEIRFRFLGFSSKRVWIYSVDCSGLSGSFHGRVEKRILYFDLAVEFKMRQFLPNSNSENDGSGVYFDCWRADLLLQRIQLTRRKCTTDVTSHSSLLS